MRPDHLWLQVHSYLGQLIANFFQPGVHPPGPVSQLIALLPLEARLKAFDYLLDQRAQSMGRSTPGLGKEILALYQQIQSGDATAQLPEKLSCYVKQLDELLNFSAAGLD